MTTPMKIAAVLAATALTLAGCQDDDAHKGQHCVSSHIDSGTRAVPIRHIGYKGHVSTSIAWVPYSETVCDKWAPKNPATVKL